MSAPTTATTTATAASDSKAADAATDVKSAPAAAAAAAVATVGSANTLGFVSEWMELRDVSGSGKGWFATKAIPAGTVLMFERGMWSIPYLPSKPEQKAASLDDLTIKFCVAGSQFGCNELTFNAEPKPKSGATTAAAGVTASGAPLVPSPYPEQYSDVQWSEARARIKTNAFQQIVPFAELPAYETAEASAAASAAALAEAREQAAYEAKGKAGEALPVRKRPRPKAYPENRSNQSELSELMVVFPCTARFNHSCWPNVTLLSPTGASIIEQLTVTIRDVPANAQLTICYFEEFVARPRDFRRSQLLRSHGFVCQCERCDESGAYHKVDIGLEKTVPLIKKKALAGLESEFDSLRRGGESERTTTGVTNAIRLLSAWRSSPAAKVLPPTHWLQFQSRTALWRLLLTFYTAAVAHKDVKTMFSAEHRATVSAIIIDELTALQAHAQTYDTRKRIFYVASLQFADAVNWQKAAPPALIKHYTHVCSFFDKLEKPYTKSTALVPAKNDSTAAAAPGATTAAAKS